MNRRIAGLSLLAVSAFSLAVIGAWEVARWWGAAVISALTALGFAMWSTRREKRFASDALGVRAESEERLADLRAETGLRDQILGKMADAVLLVQGDQVVYANPAAQAMLGARAGRPLPPQIPMDPGVPSMFEIHHPDARVMRSLVSALDGGRALVVAHDITDAIRIDQVRQDFVANASHELRTPLAGILATAETLEEAIAHDPEAAKGFAETLSREASRLSALVADLLDLAKLDRPVADLVPIDLSALVAEVVAESEEGAKRKSIVIAWSVEPRINVAGSAEDLAQMVRNLLDNAIAYTPDGGQVDARLVRRGSDAVLTVQDTGIGIASKDLPRIFERFYRVDRARSRATGGTGLGLSIVRRVVESGGGSIAAESELGAGSTFTVIFPALD